MVVKYLHGKFLDKSRLDKTQKIELSVYFENNFEIWFINEQRENFGNQYQNFLAR